MNAKIAGYTLGAVAAATYGTNPLFTLPLYNAGMSTDNVLFLRYCIAVPAVLLMLLWRGRTVKVNARDLMKMMAMGVLMALSSLGLFLSYLFMDAAIASTMLFVYPLMVALIMAFFFHEKLSLSTLVCILAAMAGIALLFKGADGMTLSVTGTLLVMLSSLSYAIYIVGVNRPGLREIPTLKVIFYVLLTGTVVFALKISMTPGENFMLPEGWLMWLNIVALAVLPTVISFICTTRAIHYIGPTPTAILGALEPVTAVLIGVFVFGESFTGRDLGGLLLIVGAVSIVVAGGNITGPLVRFRRMFPSLRSRHKK